ncbi:RNA-binding protein [Thermovenabulum sp.]|uniref:YlmH family RNA-binding protein n=1 Tax=Thermovenabulum sp. TaxID=3100335 RepID=UPI003C7E01AE
MEIMDEKLAMARIRDLFRAAEKKGDYVASNFLTPLEQEMVIDISREFPEVKFFFEGGYKEAERKILVAYPEYIEGRPFVAPVKALRIKLREEDAFPGHRDFLGSILGLGISREKIGDVLVKKGEAIVIVKEEIIEFLGLNLNKVKNFDVETEEITLKEIIAPEKSYKEVKGTVASLRLDAVASLAFGVSRSKMAPYIKGENVRVNFKIVSDPSHEVKEGDIISATRMGRAKVEKIGGESKKGRIYVTIHRFTG